jgi:hypothetical protein
VCVRACVRPCVRACVRVSLTERCTTERCTIEQFLLDARRPPAQATTKGGEMLAGNGKDYLYDTAVINWVPDEMNAEEGGEEGTFREHVLRYAASHSLRDEAHVATHFRKATKKLLKVKLNAWLKTVYLSLLPNVWWVCVRELVVLSEVLVSYGRSRR